MRLTALPGSRRSRSVAATAAAAIAVSTVLVAFSATPDAIATADGYGDGDGLNRYVLTLTASPATGAPGAPDLAVSLHGNAGDPTGGTTGAPGAAPVDDPFAAAPDGPTTLDPATLHPFTSVRDLVDIALLARAQAELGPGGEVVLRDGVALYATADAAMSLAPGSDGTVLPAPAPIAGPTAPTAQTGPSVPAGSPVTAAEAPPVQPRTPEGEAALSALAATPGVASAQWLTSGQVLVATSLDLDTLEAVPGVTDVTVSPQGDVFAEPTDPFYAPYGWNLHNTGSNAYQQSARAGADVDAPGGWVGTTGEDTVVAIVDTGFDSDHPDLVGSLWTNPAEPCGTTDTDGNGRAGDCHGWNFYANSPDVDNGANGSHGTSVAGVIGARLDNGAGSAGLAPSVRLMPLAVGGGSTVDLVLAAEAIRYAADHGADVVNASFGGPAGSVLADAIDYAIGKGTVVVAAAGNDRGNRDLDPVYPASLPNPALLTVGSSTALDTLSEFSAFGATSVDLVAPGTLVLSTWNDGGYRLVSGTSFSAPHVAAAAALYRSVDPSLTPAQVRDRMMADATRLPALAGTSVTGARLSVTALGTAADAVTYAFSGMNARPGAQAPVVTVASSAPAGVYAVRFGLAMLVDGEVWAVADEDVTLGGTSATTDDAGTVTFPLGALESLGSTTLRPTLTLGAGSFGLTVQVLLDGQPLTAPYAAPLRVTTPTPTPDDPDGAGTPAPGDGSTGDPGGPGTGDGGTGPGSGGGSTPGTGGGDAGSGDGPGAGGTDPGDGGTDPGTGGPGSGDEPSTGGGTDPGDGSEPGGGTDPGSTPTPAAPPGDGAPGTPVPAPAPAPTPTSGSGDVNPPGSDSAEFDRVGAFQVTSISPVHVGVAGGTVVQVRGDALERDLGVRVGPSGVAHVLWSSATGLTFVTPALVAGTYDVTVYKNGRTSVLPDALVYSAGTTDPGSGDGGGGGGGGDQPGASDPTDPADPTPGSTPGAGADPGAGGDDPADQGSPTPAPGTGGTNPGSGGSGDGGGGDGGSGGDGGQGGDGGAGTPTAPATTRTGPNGERLVRNDALADLTDLWAVECSATCTGRRV